ncbi:MAG: AAA family ATPase [Bacteroidales bacterium]
MFQHPYLKLVKVRIEEPGRFIQVILGPRQVGKTTMVTQLLSQLSILNLYVSADAIQATIRRQPATHFKFTRQFQS